MTRKPQRTVEAAILERIGPVTSGDMLKMPAASWGLIRDQITDRRNGKDGLIAKCMACDCEVFIKVKRSGSVSLPLFSHYAGSDPNCRWYQGRNIAPNDARAAQYQGRQESNFHRLMCEQIAELVALDSRYIRHTVAEYLAPTQNDYGRFPDIYVEWDGFGPFAVEFQMSGTFQTEISARCKHYEREGMPMLWILFGIDTTRGISQSFQDVIRRHRGNAFMLDPAAIAASREMKTLVLSCYTMNGGRLDGPRLVRFDELTIPRSKLPYWEDRLAAPRLKEIENRRQPWFSKLENWDHHTPFDDLDRSQSLLLAAAFSIAANANGKQRNYASNHPNIKAMLNTYLNSGSLAPYANLLTQLIENTKISNLLKTTVGEHLRRQINDMQADPSSPEWKILRHLLPEALDPILREELRYLDALPDWARPYES